MELEQRSGTSDNMLANYSVSDLGVAVDRGGGVPFSGLTTFSLTGVDHVIQGLNYKPGKSGHVESFDCTVRTAKHLEGIPSEYRLDAGIVNGAGTDTKAIFSSVDVRGITAYHSDRLALHQMLVAAVLRHVRPAAKRVAILTAGGPASGKSSIMPLIDDIYPRSEDSSAFISSDVFKEGIPEYHARLHGDNPEEREGAAGFSHRESGDITSVALDRAIKSGRRFIYDSTCSSSEYVLPLISMLKSAGYEVHLHYADLDVEKAVEREDRRYQEEGRHVPEDILRASHAGAIGALAVLHTAVDSVHVWNTDVPRGQRARLAYRREEGHNFTDPVHLELMRQRGHTFHLTVGS